MIGEGQRRILTGDRPTGKLHLGHYVGSLANRVKLQEEYDLFITVVDLHMLTDNAEDPERVKNVNASIRELILGYLSVGIDPDKVTILRQSAIPEISELFTILMNFVTIGRAQRIPTLKEKVRDQQIRHPSLGLLNYPVLQAADILSVRARLVPVGKDQESHIELTREVARVFNRLYGEVFPIPQALIGEVETLVGLDGKAKMSKSLDNAIYLSDDPATVRRKVMGMFTDPKRVRADIPGTVEGNPVFVYHTLFNDDPDEVEELKKRYRQGRIGDVEVKTRLVAALERFLTPIRQRRRYYEQREELLWKILQQGTARAQREVQQTLQLVKQAMGLV